VCCASRGDLLRAVGRLVSSGRELDHVRVECSGLVDPGPVVESLVSPQLAERLAHRGTVTCVDSARARHTRHQAPSGWWAQPIAWPAAGQRECASWASSASARVVWPAQ
jgi:G3E family GTPase